MDQVLSTFFDLSYMKEAFPLLLKTGLLNTAILSAGASVVGLVVGIIIAMMAISRHAVLRWPAKRFIDIFRGLPAVVTILLVGQGLPIANLRIFGSNPYGYAIVALALIAGAYNAEIFRSGIQAVDAGQMQAARSLGLGYLPAMRHIIVPQGVRHVLPALTNQVIINVKDSSLVYFLGLAIGQRDLFIIGQQLAQNTGNLSALTLAGIFYLIITVPLTYVVNHWDERLRSGKKQKPIAEADEDLALSLDGSRL